MAGPLAQVPNKKDVGVEAGNFKGMGRWLAEIGGTKWLVRPGARPVTRCHEVGASCNLRTMIVPVLLVVLSLLGLAASLTLPGYRDFVLLALPSALASLFILGQAWFRRDKTVPNWIVVDGSNVMHWLDETPQIETLRVVVAELQQRGYVPSIIFDANAGYKLTGRYQNDRALGRALGLPADQVMVVPKGTPADPTVLAAARDFGARIVTNDRYRDWAEAYPEVREPGRFVRGGFRAGTLWMHEPDDAGGAGRAEG